MPGVPQGLLARSGSISGEFKICTFILVCYCGFRQPVYRQNKILIIKEVTMLLIQKSTGPHSPSKKNSHCTLPPCLSLFRSLNSAKNITHLSNQTAHNLSEKALKSLSAVPEADIFPIQCHELK